MFPQQNTLSFRYWKLSSSYNILIARYGVHADEAYFPFPAAPLLPLGSGRSITDILHISVMAQCAAPMVYNVHTLLGSFGHSYSMWAWNDCGFK
jgi:hypothetical protein